MPHRNNLLWRLAAVFVFILVVFTGISFFIFSRGSVAHSNELNQRLNKDLASHTVKEVSQYISNGELNQDGLMDIMHSMMVINPSVEVYMLNNEGEILSYVAPEKEVKMKKVALKPIQDFIHSDFEQVIEGEDPKTPGECRIFSAAPIMEKGEQIGYVYIVLAGQKFTSTAGQIAESRILSLTLQTILMVLLFSMLIGLIAFWFITNRLNKMIETMNQFRKGNLRARIEEKGEREFKLIAKTFNEMADSLEKNIEELKSLDKLRRELITNISHDLRTPISSIQGYAETLEMKQGNLSKESEKEYLQTIVKNSKRLSQLVEGLFELSKLESGHLKIKTTPFSIVELVHDVAAKYRLISKEKGVSINTIVHKESPQVLADISLIDRVLQNLIDNAIKFCKPGDTINIEIDIEDPRMVKIHVADTGIGIKKENIDQIFDRYFKSDNIDVNKEGTGLGLSIAKKIIDLHGGTLSVNSQLHVGSTFSFDLPTAA